MANVNRANGFRPVRHLDGSAWNGQIETYAVLAADATALGAGDIVKFSGAGDANGVPAVTKIAANTDVVAGVVVGFIPDYSNLNLPGSYRPASTLRYAMVVVDPSVVYEAQASGAFAVATDPGQNAGVTFTAASASTGMATTQVDMATKATTATLPVKIIGVVQRADVDLADTSNMKIHVTLNNHVLSAGTAGI